MDDVFDDMAEHVEEIEERIKSMKRQSDKQDTASPNEPADNMDHSTADTKSSNTHHAEKPPRSDQKEKTGDTALWESVSETNTAYDGFQNETTTQQSTEEENNTLKEPNQQTNETEHRDDSTTAKNRRSETTPSTSVPRNGSDPSHNTKTSTNSFTEKLRTAVRKAKHGGEEDFTSMYHDLVLELRKLAAHGDLTNEQESLFRELRDAVDTNV